ncbi:protein LONGIFOLIA 2-like [Mangifera indica]|uniref:protein LONGIFOLIA 2-like n=1 Tax=Mangifera indica TaxID=29780 RepID=UPI001CFBAC8D|nr:protein LONGIFOLIA 2-like [Mangifera indica]
MSAKLLRSISDENPDLPKQIGCMNGIFQLFDRHRFLSGRCIHRSQKRLPPGQKDNNGAKSKSSSQPPTGKHVKKAMKEKQKVSTESSRTSFSSSSCSSSFSSIDCNKQAQTETSSYGQTNVAGAPVRDSPVHQPNDSLQLSRQPVDIRNFVKDSMYREARGISIKTRIKENDAGGQILKYMDSPRPLQQPKPIKSRFSCVNEEFQVLGKLREAPRKSNEQKDGFAVKDTPRFSYDSRESREAFKSIIKLKELPRLSLDGRERSMRGSTAEMKSNYLIRDLQRGDGNCRNIFNQEQEPGSHKGPSSVVAKLMGLETFPDSMSTDGNQPGHTKTASYGECDSFSRISRTADSNKQNGIGGSPRNSTREPVSPRMKNADSAKKSIANCKAPIEPAPWRLLDGSKGQIPTFKSRETQTNAPNSSLSVYGEIEKRLAQLEFKKSGKDLRALKQILAAMQKTKEVLESRKEDQPPTIVPRTGNNNSIDQSSRLANSKNQEGDNQTSATVKGNGSPRSIKSSTVDMKAAKCIEKASNFASSVILPENLSGLQGIRIGESSDSRKESDDKQTATDPTQRIIHQRDPSSQKLHPINKNASAKTLRSAQCLKNPQLTAGKSKSRASSKPANPRLQQKKLGLERQSHSTILSSDFSKTRSQPIESGPPHRRCRLQYSQVQQSDDQMSDVSSDLRDLSHQGDASSLRSESNISIASHVDIEVTSIDRSNKIPGGFFQQQDQKDRAPRCNENWSMAEPTKIGQEQPSPVSVLNTTFYRDEPPSPVEKISHPFRDVEAVNSDEAEWIAADLNHLSNCRKPSFSSEDYRGIENAQHLVPNLIHRTPTHEKPIIDEIAPIHDSTNPDHRYISKILLASGLLRDFEASIMAIQLHPSGHLINPNLFYVLEQTEASTKLLNDKGMKVINSEPTPEKARRKLVFDAVNEILVQKLVLARSSNQWFSASKAAKKSIRLQLLRGLCSEVDCQQVKQSNCNLGDEDDTLRQDLMHGSMIWAGYESEISCLVLDVERLIFKDLISELVRYETTRPQGQAGRHCRQLFSK